VAAQQGGSKVYREFKSLGSKVIETNQPLAGPENEKDFWEGEQFDVSYEMLAFCSTCPAP
jgi:hypothetical protein